MPANDRTDVTPMTLQEVAEEVGGHVLGDPSVRVGDVAPLDQAGPQSLALLADGRYVRDLAESGAGAVLVSEGLAQHIGPERPAVVVKDARAALVPLLALLYEKPKPSPNVHPTAVIAQGVGIGRDVSIGPYAVIEEDAEVGHRVRVGPHAVVGRGSRLGDDVVLHAHVVLYPGTILAHRVVVHAGARLGSDGFGYALRDGEYQKIPQVGGCIVEEDVEIGANACVDRGSIGDTVVGRGTKLDNLVHLAHNVRVGPNCAMAALVGIAGSTRIGEGSVFGGQSGAFDHVEIGEGVQVGGQAGVTGNLDAGEKVTGFPARDVGSWMRAWAIVLRLPDLGRRVREIESELTRLARSGTGGAERV